MNNNTMMRMVWCLALAYAACLLPMDALAANVSIGIGGGMGGGGGDSATIGGLLCRVANWFTGSVGQGIATLAIIVIGIGALMGKVSWGMAIIVGIGVAVIFGAPTIVGELSGGLQGC
jgi:type IV secretion system protein VirB2